jgi:hypothetical protein
MVYPMIPHHPGDGLLAVFANLFILWAALNVLRFAVEVARWLRRRGSPDDLI